MSVRWVVEINDYFIYYSDFIVLFFFFTNSLKQSVHLCEYIINVNCSDCCRKTFSTGVFFFLKHLFKKSIGGLLHYDWPTKCRPCWNEITSNWNRRNAQWKRSQKRSVDQQKQSENIFVHRLIDAFIQLSCALCCALRPTRQDLPLSSCQGVSWSCLGPNSQKWLPLLPRSPLSTAWIKSQLGFVQFLNSDWPLRGFVSPKIPICHGVRPSLLIHSNSCLSAV